jgi:hypothetical protein
VEVLGTVVLVTAILTVVWAILFFSGSKKNKE